MSTDVAAWKQAMAEQAAAVGKAEAAGGVGFISLKGGRMTLGDDPIPGDSWTALCWALAPSACALTALTTPTTTTRPSASP